MAGLIEQDDRARIMREELAKAACPDHLVDAAVEAAEVVLRLWLPSIWMATEVTVASAADLVATVINACNLTRPDQVRGSVIAIRAINAYTERNRA